MDKEQGINKITETIIGAAITVHRTFGHGLNVEILGNGIQRVVNNFPDPLRTQRSQR